MIFLSYDNLYGNLFSPKPDVLHVLIKETKLDITSNNATSKTEVKEKSTNNKELQKVFYEIKDITPKKSIFRR